MTDPSTKIPEDIAASIAASAWAECVHGKDGISGPIHAYGRMCARQAYEAGRAAEAKALAEQKAGDASFMPPMDELHEVDKQAIRQRCPFCNPGLTSGLPCAFCRGLLKSNLRAQGIAAQRGPSNARGVPSHWNYEGKTE